MKLSTNNTVLLKDIPISIIDIISSTGDKVGVNFSAFKIKVDSYYKELKDQIIENDEYQIRINSLPNKHGYMNAVLITGNNLFYIKKDMLLNNEHTVRIIFKP